MDARRGYEPEDDRNFSSEAIEILRNASRHVIYLINEGYNLKRAVTFTGDHYLLSKRQRLAVMRSGSATGPTRCQSSRNSTLIEEASPTAVQQNRIQFPVSSV